MAVLLAVFSGAAGLGHELLWTRRLLDLLGASAEAQARVFGAFFLGLALGAGLAARWLPRIRRPWRAVAVAEFLVVILTLPALGVPVWSGRLWPALGLDLLLSWQGACIQGALSLLVVLPPALCMGLFLPLVTHATLGERRSLGRHAVGLYAANTLGGLLGLIWVAAALLPWLGVTRSMIAMMLLNAGVALGALVLDARRNVIRQEAVTQTKAKPSAESCRSGRTEWRPLLGPLFAAFHSGFGLLAFEVLSLNTLLLVAPLSFHAPAVILAGILLVLALSAVLVMLIPARSLSRRPWLPWILAASAVLMALANVWFMSRAVATGGLPPQDGWVAFLTRLLALTLTAFGPAVLVAGCVFPLAMRWAEERSGDQHHRTLGVLLAVNGLGGFLGAEIAYRWLMPVLGVHVGTGVLALTYVLAALGLAVPARTSNSRIGWKVPAVGGVACLAILWISLRTLPLVNPHMGLRVLEHRAGRDGTLAVVEHDRLGRAILVANQYMLGSTGVRYDQERLGHLPLMLHPRPDQVAFIGLATGITAGAAVQHDAVGAVTVVELSPLVVEAAARHFSNFNHDVTRSPRVRVLEEDGRTVIAAAPGRFDVIIGDLFLPWAPGAGRLFSREHFESVRTALRPGGVYCQWLPMHQLTEDQWRRVAATFGSVFGDVWMFQGTYRSQAPSLALVGYREAALDWEGVRARCDHERQKGGVRDPLMRHAEGVASLFLGRHDWRPGSHGLNTLGNAWLELDAGRLLVAGGSDPGYLRGTRWQAFLSTLPPAESGLTGLPGRWPAAGITLTGRTSDPRAAPSAGSVASLIPPGVLSDSGADWTHWSGPVIRPSVR